MITSKQRAYLRSLANSLEPIFQIGKGGLSDNIYKQFYDALEARELVKASVLNNAELTAKEAAAQISAKIGAEVVQVIGGKFVLYKQSREHKQIVL